MPNNPAEIIPLLRQHRVFNGLDDEQLERIAIGASIEELKPGERPQVVEEIDYPLFVIISGKILQTFPKGKSQEEVRLKQGDIFGADVLFFGRRRPYRAIAVAPTRLITIPADRLATLLRVMPGLKANIRYLLDLYRITRSNHFRWIAEDETVYQVSREHIAYLLVHLIPPIAVAGLAGLIFMIALLAGNAAIRMAMEFLGVGILMVDLLWGIWRYLDWFNDYYIVTDQRVVWLERVILLYDSQQEIPLTMIQSMDVTTTFIGRYLGFGNVIIRSLLGQVIFHNVENPNAIRNLVDILRKQAKETITQTDRLAMERVIRRKIDPAFPGAETVSTLNVPAQNQMAEANVQGLRQSITDYFATRLVVGDAIVYRKHIFILLTKIWLPTLTVGVIFGATIFFYLRTLAAQGSGTTGLMVLLLGMLPQIVPVLWWLYQYVDWRNDIYMVTIDKIIDSERKPLGDEITKSAPLSNIQSLDYQRIGILGILLNFGTVYIRIGTDQNFDFRGIPDPARAQRDIFRKMSEYRRQKELVDSKQQWEQVSEWLAAYHRQVGEMQNPQNSSNSDQDSG
jgi:CRP-like cAMP-binding protein